MCKKFPLITQARMQYNFEQNSDSKFEDTANQSWLSLWLLGTIYKKLEFTM